MDASIRTPECGIVTLLGNKLKGVWKIGIHWLKAVKNKLTSPWDIETIKVGTPLAFTQIWKPYT